MIAQYVTETDPRYALSASEMKISRLIAAPLVSVDQQSLEPKLELAERLDRIDPVTWEVTVRADARFPDGTPLGARDVVFTFRTTMDPAMRSPFYKAFFERLERVEALDERRVRFRLRAPLATFVTDLDMGIVSAAAAERAGRDGRFAGGGVVGAGPFQVASIRTGEVVLERNPHYHDGAPPMRRVVIRTMQDTNTRLLVLVGGSADAALNDVRLDLIKDVRRAPRLKVQTGPSAVLTYLMMHNEDEILRDVRVRRAIAHAIDREKLIRRKLGGLARLATGLVPPAHWAYEPDVPRYPYDPARAGALLDEAGFPDPDGDGPRPRFTLTYKTSSDGFRISIARLIAQDLAAVGIGVEVRPFEFATVFSDIKKGSYQLASMQTGEIVEPDMHYHYFHSSRIPTPEFPNSANRWRYRSDKADALIERGRHELDREERGRVYAELQRVIARDLPIVPLWHEDYVAVLNRDVEGFELLPNGRLSSLARVTKRR